jgi:hypothetical protein
MTAEFIWASEVRWALKSGQPVDNSGPGARCKPTPSVTFGRKPKAGPPILEQNSQNRQLSHPKSCPGGGLKRGRVEPSPFSPSRDELQACLIACNLRQFDARRDARASL